MAEDIQITAPFRFHFAATILQRKLPSHGSKSSIKLRSLIRSSKTVTLVARCRSMPPSSTGGAMWRWRGRWASVLSTSINYRQLFSPRSDFEYLIVHYKKCMHCTARSQGYRAEGKRNIEPMEYGRAERERFPSSFRRTKKTPEGYICRVITSTFHPRGLTDGWRLLGWAEHGLRTVDRSIRR